MNLLEKALLITWGLTLGAGSAQAAVNTAVDSLAVRQTTPTPTVESGLNPKNATTNATTDRYIMIRFDSATVNHIAADAQADDPVRRVGSRPDFAVLVYPVITMEMPLTHAGSRKSLLGPDPDEETVNQASSHKHVTQQTPPTLLVHSKDDTAVPIKNSELFLEALKENHVQCRMLTYNQGGHGYGIGKKGTDATAWPEECLKWMREIGSLN